MIFSLPRQVVTDLDGSPVAGALVYFYQSGTSNPQQVYADIDHTTALGHPITADGYGILPAIYLDGRAADYKVTVMRPGGTLLYTQDGVPARQRPSQAGTATFPNATVVQVSFSPSEPDTNYRVILGSQVTDSRVWVSNKTTTGFILNSANTSTGLVDWVVLR